MAKIFDRGFNDYSNVVIGDKFTNEASYIIGYWGAGDILVDIAIKLNSPKRDRLFFPICYNYRQFVELCLKQLILEAEEIYFILENNNMQNKKYNHKFSEKINKTHSIDKLLNWLIIILDCFTNEKISKDIIKYILEYHNMDKTGQRFRYHKSTENEIHFEIREDYDLEKIKYAINKIGNYLMGIDAYLYEFGNFTKTYISEMENSLYNLGYNYQENYYFR